MSINNINIIRIVAFLIIFVAIVLLIIVFLSTFNRLPTEENHRPFVKKFPIAILMCVFVIGLCLFYFSQTFSFHVDDELKNMLVEVTSSNIEKNQFERVSDEQYSSSDRLVLSRDYANVNVICTIQKKMHTQFKHRIHQVIHIILSKNSF